MQLLEAFEGKINQCEFHPEKKKKEYKIHCLDTKFNSIRENS